MVSRWCPDGVPMIFQWYTDGILMVSRWQHLFAPWVSRWGPITVVIIGRFPAPTQPPYRPERVVA
eukprot:1147516-Pyramimonas_sp.AAC.1